MIEADAGVRIPEHCHSWPIRPGILRSHRQGYLFHGPAVVFSRLRRTLVVPLVRLSFGSVFS